MTRESFGSFGLGRMRYDPISSNVGMGNSIVLFVVVGVYPTALQAFRQKN
jgi:hypothetical protein